MTHALLTSILAFSFIGAAAPVQDAGPNARLLADAPAIVLSGIPFHVELEATDGVGLVPFVLVNAAGRELARGTLEEGESRTLTGLKVEDRAELPLTIRSGPDAIELTPRILPGWTSLLPPLLAILLALIVREVVTSLFFGVWLGALLYAGLNPLTATMRTIDTFITPSLADIDHASIIVFSFLLGGMVGVMSRSGGTYGIVEAVRPIATTPRRAQIATWLAGLGIFFDDYANTLIVGNTMRPITDSMRVSREKLAYIVDSTAAPVAAIVFVSTWAGFEISLIGDGLAAAALQPGLAPDVQAALANSNPFTVFIHSIPYLFYPILALFMVLLIAVTERDFGPMATAEARAARGEGLYRDGAMLMVDTSGGAMEPKESIPHRWFNAAAPVMAVIFVVLAGLYFEGRANLGGPGSLWEVFGEADPFHALLWGSLAGCIVAVVLAIGQRLLTPHEAINAWLGGIRAMLLAGVILVLAWSLSEVTAVLGTASFLSQLLEGNLMPEMLPVVVFATAATIAFATGTSWGTMAILIPISIPLAVAFGGSVGFEYGNGYVIMLGTISSVLAGAIFGDHCSPISDTTVLSSMASACDHVDHVRTQLPYALVVAVVGMALGDIPTAFGMPPIVTYLFGAVVLYGIVQTFGKRRPGDAGA
jgi:Na+/H+ antiporter NhaC